jgi:hypothetical protein
MRNDSNESCSLLKNSALYREFLAEREEILRHKWLESEKAGYDIGFERALLDWIMHHRAEWKRQREAQRRGQSHAQDAGNCMSAQ